MPDAAADRRRGSDRDGHRHARHRARLAGSRTRVVAKCGHWATFERPKETASALEEFLLQRH